MKNYDLSKIPVVFTDKFPENYVNDVNGWAFSKEYIRKNIGKLLTLDIDFGIKCSLNCPHCFRKNNSIDKHNKENYLKYKEIIKIIGNAKKLGLKSVKFLGRGEPFEEKKLLNFLVYLRNNNIIPLIFTKGHILGSDKEVKRIYSEDGINNSKELISFLKKMNASILLGFNSFNEEIQNRMVGYLPSKNQRQTYWHIRNRALKLLVNAGFNQTNPTKLCLASNPVTNENYHEIFDIYKWGRERNMYVIVTPSMISGRASRNYLWKKINPSSRELIDLYTKIYLYNIKKNIQTYSQILEEGISGYAGGHPCNQVSVGMYITLNGTVLRCPGGESPILGNIREKSLEDIWRESENYGRAGQFNCGCPPKFGKSIPFNLFTDVLINLKKHFNK